MILLLIETFLVIWHQFEYSSVIYGWVQFLKTCAAPFLKFYICCEPDASDANFQ